MRVLELFAGYGSQALALENLGIWFTSDISEIDQYAIKAYNQIHGETKNWGDICKIDETKLPYYDLITYSSPCQDFSVAGLNRGGDKGTGTRSSLLWECERIIRAVKPKYLLMENVKNLVGKKHKHNFIKWLNVLESLGYQNFWQVLNAKDYGVPQNRERVFVVSILGGGQYLFPNQIPLEKRLKDILEPQVDEKYYISDDLIGKLSANIQKDVCGTIRCGGRGSLDKNHSWDIVAEPLHIKEPLACASRGRNPENPSDRTAGIATEQRLEINNTGCSNTLTSVQKDNYVIESKVLQIGNIIETDSFGGNPQCGRIYSPDGCCTTLNTCGGGGREPKIVEPNVGHHPFSKKYEFNGFQTDVSPCLIATDYKAPKCTMTNNYRIRKLTPRECWRLMGVKDEQFDKLHDISNTQLYKLAGNSIVVDVLMAIFKNMFLSDEGTKGQLELF